MILGVGIDSVEIARIVPWIEFTRSQLLRIFHPDELDYCFKNRTNTAERLAARFAAREACFKALAPHSLQPIPFLTLCRAIRIANQASGAPELLIDWDLLEKNGYFKDGSNLKCHISLTHTQTTATAFIVLEYR